MILALALTLATSSASPVTRIIPERRYEAQLIRVLDGDSVVLRIAVPSTVHLPGQDIDVTVATERSVRLSGIDTPELSRPQCDIERKLAERAKTFLTEKLTGAHLVFVTRGPEADKYARWLGNIEADGVLVTRSLIDAGLADPYDGGAREPDRWCR